MEFNNATWLQAFRQMFGEIKYGYQLHVRFWESKATKDDYLDFVPRDVEHLRAIFRKMALLNCFCGEYSGNTMLK